MQCRELIILEVDIEAELEGRIIRVPIVLHILYLCLLKQSCTNKHDIAGRKTLDKEDGSSSIMNVLHAMLDTFSIDNSKLLTDEVRAKVSVVESLEDVAHVLVVYEEESRAYHYLSTFL